MSCLRCSEHIYPGHALLGDLGVRPNSTISCSMQVLESCIRPKSHAGVDQRLRASPSCIFKLSSISRLVRGKPDDIWTIWSVTLTHCLTIAATRCHRIYRLGNLPAIQGSALHPKRFFYSLYSKIVKSATWGARMSKREIGLEKPVVCSRPSKSAFDLS
jgi:hypothetical protein